ncbi:MAG: hypothetical protein IT165_27095 [Bryobacterales bacterium]|nr:hypothetical protein [Bryobacterales bacterium]
MTRLLAMFGLILCMGAPALPAQYSRRGAGQRRQMPAPNSSAEALAQFNGTLKTITRKKLTLEMSDGNTLEFFCSKKTVYFDGKDKISQSSLKPDDLLTVDAKAAIDGSLDAVKVRRLHEPAANR